MLAKILKDDMFGTKAPALISFFESFRELDAKFFPLTFSQSRNTSFHGP
jgi:hypothetical protein